MEEDGHNNNSSSAPVPTPPEGSTAAPLPVPDQERQQQPPGAVAADSTSATATADSNPEHKQEQGQEQEQEQKQASEQEQQPIQAPPEPSASAAAPVVEKEDEEDSAAAVGSIKERWDRLARLASLEEVRQSLAALAQTYEAEAAGKVRLSERLEEDLADSERQLEAAVQAHGRHVAELQAFHERRCAMLREGWERDAKALQEEFKQERVALLRAHAEECDALRAALAAMDAYEKAQGEAAARSQARLRGLAVARGKEAVRALRRSLCAQLEALERQLEEQQQQPQHPHQRSYHPPLPSSAAAPGGPGRGPSSQQHHQQLLLTGPISPAPAPNSKLASDVARLGQRDQAMVRQLERRVRKVEQYHGQMREWRARLTSTGREHSERNQTLLVEKRALLDQCQKLKRHMNGLREEQERQLRALNESAGAALDGLQAKMELGLRILHLSELAVRKEEQQEELLAMLEMPAGVDTVGDQEGAPFAIDPAQQEGEQQGADGPSRGGSIDGGMQGTEEKGAAAAAATGKSWDDLAAFWTRYNKALLSKLLLNGERDRLEEEHRLLQAAVKHHREGTRVSDNVMAGANPLLMVQGGLTEDGRTPPPSPDKRSRPNVIEANHMLSTGRLDTRPFM